jgi:hypothetical protein
MNRQVAVLLLAAAAAGFAREPGFGEFRAVQESLSRMPAKFRAEWLLKRGLDASRYTEYHRPESTGLRLRGKWGRGPSNEVTGRGNLVALTLGSEVALLNFANPASPVVLSEIQLNFIPRQTALHDSFLLTCGNGIEIWNIADSTHPVYRNVIPYGVGDFAIVDTFLYFGSWGTFYAYSIANAASPYELGRCADSGYVTTATKNVAVLRELDDVLGFIDVSNPAAPHRVGTYPSYALDADARGSICCAAIYWSTDDDHFRFEVLDISDPANVRRIGSIDSVGGWDIHLSGPFAFVSGFQTSEWEFTIVDVQDSTQPHVVSSCATPSNNYGVWADWTSDRAFVADMTGLAVVDISNINSPVYDTTLLAADEAQDVWLDGSRAYIADYAAGLRILDVADPAQPTDLGGIDSINSVTQSAVGRDSFAFIGWAQPPYLRTIDVTDPSRPRTAGGCRVFDWPADMVLRDSLLYVAQAYRFQVVNVARPRQPVLVGSCVTMDGTEFGLAIQDSFAYMMSGWLQIVNVARPDSPFIVSTTSGGATGIAVRDTFAYVPNVYDTLWVYSVADPAHPRILSSSPTSVWPKDVALGVSTLYVGTVDNHVDIFELSDPAQPVRVGRITAASDVNRLWYADGKLYAATWDAGVAIYETTSAAISDRTEPQGMPLAFRVWPSIATDRVRFAATGLAPESDVEVFDMMGKKLRNVPVQAETKGGATQGEIGFADLPAGVYVIRVNSEERNLTAKVVRTSRR